MKRAIPLVAVACLLATSPAWADFADQRFQAGMKAAEQGRYEEARQAFADAYSLQPTQPTLWNLAMAEYRTGKYVDAIRHVKLYMRQTPRESRYEALAPQFLERLGAQTCHVEIETVAGADVYVDDDRMNDKAPLPDAVDVAAGDHTIEVKKGERGANAKTTCAVGQTVHVRVLFDDPTPPPPPPPVPTVTAPRPPPPPPRDPGAERGEFWSTGRIVGFSVAGAGLVAGVTGFAIFSVQKSSASDDAAAITSRLAPDACRRQPSLPDCGELRSLGKDFDRAEVLRGVSLVTGGLIVAGGVTYALVLAGPKKAASTVVVPIVGAGVGGVGVSGAF